MNYRVMAINYKLESTKPKLIKWVKDNTIDFCNDMFIEIKTAAENQSPDDIEMFLNNIREAEKLSVQYTNIINEANTIADILKITDEDVMCNIFYDREDEVLSVILENRVERIY